MGVYSIKELEKIAGIKAHTIRIWEQRYDLLNPKRTETNIRMYSDEDLKYLLNVSLLQKAGHKISKIAKYDENTLKNAIEEASQANLKKEAKIQELIVGMVDFNEQKIIKTIDGCIKIAGINETMKEVIFPFLIKIGVLWLAGNINPAQEHFISCLIRQKIISEINKLSLQNENDNTTVLFLPEKETHELALLYANFLLRNNGINTIYLGQNVPLEALVETYKSIKPKSMICSITIHQSSENLQKYIDLLGENFVGSRIFVSGGQIYEKEKKINFPKNIESIHSFEILISKIT